MCVCVERARLCVERERESVCVVCVSERVVCERGVCERESVCMCV